MDLVHHDVYSLKYALCPLKKEKATGDELIGYIVSKVYLLNEIEKEDENGNIRKCYEVFFPYITYAGRLISRHHYLRNGLVIDRKLITVISNVYDSFEEAKVIAEEKNKDYPFISNYLSSERELVLLQNQMLDSEQLRQAQVIDSKKLNTVSKSSCEETKEEKVEKIIEEYEKTPSVKSEQPKTLVKRIMGFLNRRTDRNK